MRLALAVASVLVLAAPPLFAQEPEPSPAATPVLNPPPPAGETRNLISGEIVPLVVINYLQLEYERVLDPSLGGIAVRGRADYLWVGVFSLGDVGAGVHYDMYLPWLVHDASNPTGPGGAFMQFGADAQWWRGTFHAASYRSTVSGWDVEPNVYAGYRIVLGNFFLAPRAGVGYAIGGAHYVDDNGVKAYVARTRGLRGHLDLMLGLAW